eukprot:6195620-Pleurochrysis_carterae.AAC.1
MQALTHRSGRDLRATKHEEWRCTLTRATCSLSDLWSVSANGDASRCAYVKRFLTNIATGENR